MSVQSFISENAAGKTSALLSIDISRCENVLETINGNTKEYLSRNRFEISVNLYPINGRILQSISRLISLHEAERDRKLVTC